MPTPLPHRRLNQLLGALLVAASLYLFLTAKEFAATVLASRADLPKLQLATRLSPGNADYRNRLGRYHAFISNDPQAAIASYRAAVTLNPHNAHYWFDLANAYRVTGNIADRRLALDRALQSEPTAPDVAWEAANFFIVDGDTPRALREFGVVIANDNSLVDAALQQSWRIRPDADALLTGVVPARPDSLLAFLSLLMSKGQTDAAIKTFSHLADLHQKFDSRYLFEYVNYLIQSRLPDAATSAWAQSAPALGLAAYLPTDDNLVVNGDFSLDVLNGGFDWTYINRTGVRPLLDASDFREGRRSLSLTFEGPGISDAGIQQLIPVRAGTAYDFSAYYKSADFEGAGGPEIVLRDAYSGAGLFASDPLTDADFWKEVHSTIKTPAETVLVRLAVERFPAGSPIRGKLWLNDFQLSPDESPASTNADSIGDSKDDKS